jgi:hypothetical protein
MDKLDADLAQLRKAFNDRIVFVVPTPREAPLLTPGAVTSVTSKRSQIL